MLNGADSQRFEEILSLYDAGNYLEALTALRSFASRSMSPLDKAECDYYEVLLLIELHEVTEARQRATELKKLLAPVIQLLGSESETQADLSLKLQYADLIVMVAEQRTLEAIESVNSLLSTYKTQLSAPRYSDILQRVQTFQGILLADAGKWEQALPLLEATHPPNAWKHRHSFYLGQAYYECEKYERAKQKLTEAIDLGLEVSWESQAHYLLGLIGHYLSDERAAKREFELCANTGDSGEGDRDSGLMVISIPGSK